MAHNPSWYVVTAHIVNRFPTICNLTGWMIRGLKPVRANSFFSSSKSSRPALGATHRPVKWVPWFFSGAKCDVDHSPSSSVEVKNEWSYTSASCTWFHGVGGDNSTFYGKQRFITVSKTAQSLLIHFNIVIFPFCMCLDVSSDFCWHIVKSGCSGMAGDRSFVATWSYIPLCFKSLHSDLAEGKTNVCGLKGSQHSLTVICIGTNKNE